MNKNNLVKISNILKELKSERIVEDERKIISSKYPSGSEAIRLDEEEYIVINNLENEETITKNENYGTLKERDLKYNPSFYLSTVKNNEPDIIDWNRNKGKLINEAYKEVSFLPKDIISTTPFDSFQARKSVRSVIDTKKYSSNDFDDFAVTKSQYYKGDEYDEIYRVRCVFNDITGNETLESLIIKAYRTSNIPGKEYSYEILNNDYMKNDLENLEKKIEEGTKITENSGSRIQAVYSKISKDEYDKITKNIENGIKKYYQERRNVYFRLIRVDIKAIYALRMKKIPIDVKLLLDNSPIAQMSTYYSMVDNEFNVFSCPHCQKLSNLALVGEKFSIHVDQDYRNMEDAMFGLDMPIGCNNCMENCSKCGRWHFSLGDFEKVIGSGYQPMSTRKFLKNYADNIYNVSDLCSCKEYLNWIYDDMSLVQRNQNIEPSKLKIIDNFLFEGSKLVFINYLTGEELANNKDFSEYIYNNFIKYLSPIKAEMIFKGKKKNPSNDEIILMKTEKIRNIIDLYINDEVFFNNNGLGHIKLNELIMQIIKSYKTKLSDHLNINMNNIRCTSINSLSKCESCKHKFYNTNNFDGEVYYNSSKKLCHCCDEAIEKELRVWDRKEDGLTFFRTKNSKDTFTIYHGISGDENYDKWLKKTKEKILKSVSKLK